MCKRFNPWTLKVLFFGIFLLTTTAVGNTQDKLLISGYGNMHYMDHDGSPKVCWSKRP